MNPTLTNTANETIASSPALGPSLLQAVAALLIVIGLIFMTAWLLRRFAFGGQLGRGLRQPKPGRNLAITETLWVDARHRVVTITDTTNTTRSYTVLIGPQQALQLAENPPASMNVLPHAISPPTNK